MYKAEIRSLIKNSVAKYDKVAKFHDRFLDATIGKVLQQLYNEVYDADPLALQRFTKRYGDTSIIAVSYDASAELYYSSYPTGTDGVVRIVPIPDKASGVRRITTRSQGGMTFHPLDNREVELVASGSFFETVTNKIGYIPTNERIEYYNMSAAVSAIGVRMDLLVDFSEYADTDVVLIPEIVGQSRFRRNNTDSVEDAFAFRVLRMLAVIPPVDLSDNNKDPIREQ